MSDTVDKIFHLKKLVAIIIRAEHDVDNLEFFTDEQQPFQVGMHNKKAGVKLKPHVHLSNTKVITEIQEVLYIISGKVKVTFYTIDGETIAERVLTSGDALVQISQGHGFEMLEDSKIFEVKQGPYPGTEHAKIYFKT